MCAHRAWPRRDSSEVPVSPVSSLSEAPKAYSVAEFCRFYGIGRTHAYAEISAGRLRALKAGRRTLISADAAETWLNALPTISRTEGTGP